jgi:hypothetical protein
LTEAERAVLDASIAQNTRSLRLARAREALLDGDRDARRLALALVRSDDHDLRTRAKAALAALSPGVARRLARRRPVETTAGLAYPARR